MTNYKIPFIPKKKAKKLASNNSKNYKILEPIFSLYRKDAIAIQHLMLF